jgi:DNA-binding XRE family transcriptional regulator
MHPLKQYLQDIDETIQDFAQRVGASRQTLYRIIGGNQTPKPALARRIVEATGAAVAFEALYHGDPAQGEVVGLRAEYDAPLLEQDRLKVSLAIVINHLSPQDRQSPPDEAVEIAAEAVVNTYAALSPVTTRQGPDRLRQALWIGVLNWRRNCIFSRNGPANTASLCFNQSLIADLPSAPFRDAPHSAADACCIDLFIFIDVAGQIFPLSGKALLAPPETHGIVVFVRVCYFFHTKDNT